MIYNYNNIFKNQLFKLVLLFFIIVPAKVYGTETFPSEWLTLNYYHKNITGKYKSDIINKEFFLHKNGMNDPEAEFQEFKKYITQYAEKGSNINEMCRFPARFSLFQKHFDWMKNIKRPTCPNFEKKNRPDKITSISLVFANGYFENPGSYYGHTLLKFNYGNTTLSQESIDASVNYGAIATEHPSNPKYVIKGLLGLYKAIYTRNNDFIYTNAYTNLQMRDVWEYELNLTPEEIRSLVEHSWEMSFATFRYYFFSDNCAHRISNLIAFIKGKETFKIHGFWLTPMQVTRKLHHTGLIKNVTYHPSLQTILFKKYKSATKEDKKGFLAFFKDDGDKQQIASTLSPNSLIMTLDYLDLKVAKITLKTKDENALLELNKKRAMVLNELYKKPTEQINNSFNINAPESPAISKPTSVIRLGYGQSDGNNYTTIGYRGTNNDLLNIPTSGQEFSQFFMGNFEIKKNDSDDKIKISKAVLVEIMSLDTNPLPVNLTKKASWHLKLDYSERNSICNDCSTFGIEGKAGKSFRINDAVLVYFLTGGRLHTIEKNKDSFLTEVTDIGAITKLSEHAAINLSGRLNYNIQDGYADKLYKAEFSYSPKGAFDYRANIESDGDKSAIMFSIGLYFD